MPLRDHFHAPLNEQRHWEGFLSCWANQLLLQLSRRLPQGYFAEPHIHLGALVEADVATFEQTALAGEVGGTGNGTATAVRTPARTLAVDFPAQDVFEVRVFDERREVRLVAAIEFVSPRNKDRPSSRRAFAVKCASYLQERVSLVVVDIVTGRRNSLHLEIMQLLGGESTPEAEEAPLYATAYRTAKPGEQWQLDLWFQPLTLGAALPSLPLWLSSDLALPLELEPPYEEACAVLRIR